MWERLVAIEVTVTLVDVIEIGFLSHSAHRDEPRPPTHLLLKQRNGSYKIWQLQEGLLINLECGSQGQVMAGEEENEWLLPLSLFLSCSFAFCLSFSLTFAFLHGPSPVIVAAHYLNNPSFFSCFSSLSATASCLTISWHAQREHRSSPQFLLLALHPPTHPSPPPRFFLLLHV